MGNGYTNITLMVLVLFCLCGVNNSLSHICTNKVPSATHTVNAVVNRTAYTAINYCCPGWTGSLCDIELKDGHFTVVTGSNAVEFDVPILEFGAVSTQSSQLRQSGTRAVGVVLPIGLVVTLFVLGVVVVLTKRRYNLYKSQMRRGSFTVTYSASPNRNAPSSRQTDVDSHLYSLVQSDIHNDADADEVSEEAEPSKVADEPMLVDMADRMMSYQDRMNDLNKDGNCPSDVEEKVVNTRQDAVSFYRPTTVNITRANSDLSSEDDNDLELNGRLNPC